MTNQKSILILFEPVNQTALIKSLIENVRVKDIQIDAWNASTWKFVDEISGNDFNNISSSIRQLVFRIPKIGVLIRRILGYFIMKKIILNYTAIDIHFFTPTYFKLLDYLIKIEKPYKITIWGSDYFRVSPQRKKRQKKYYQNANIIHICTKQMKERFLLDFPFASDKICLARFGISQFDFIDQYRDRDICLLPIKNSENKIVITCGYNGSRAQQHEIIINAINQLQKELKNRLILIFPLTYGATKKYINTLKNLLFRTEITHYIFSKHLSNEENAQLRVMTDIVVNIQETDALSASLQEHLYAGNLLIAGSWLPYQIFNESGIFYLTTSLKELVEILSYCIDNLDHLQEKLKENHNKINNLSSWKTVSPVWINIYQKLLNQ